MLSVLAASIPFGLIITALLFGALLIVLFGSGLLRFIPNNSVGVVEKLFSSNGSVTKGIIALQGEAGYQPNVLRGGWHLMTPFIFRVHRLPLVTIPQGSIGYIFARDGAPLSPEQTLATNVEAHDFENVEDFLRKGGQRGPQRKIVREGTYAINLAQFVVLSREAIYSFDLATGDERLFRQMAATISDREGFAPVIIKDREDSLGVVTVHDGPSLGAGEIIAPVVGTDPQNFGTYHNNYQDAERFIAAGGRRGRQYQVLVEGTYFINRLFATVEIQPKSVVEVGSAGVVVSYVGGQGVDISGSNYKHGELVEEGFRGVWQKPLLPGKYAFNTYAGKIINVPTTNFILKWSRGEVGVHRYDENLAEVSLITKDAFEPTLPLSVVVHIDYRKAPFVIQRFGDIKKLVEQTLDPMVSAYFKNVAQTRTLIQLIQERSQIQQQAAQEMRGKFSEYNLELEEVLIGTPRSGEGQQIEQILSQLRSRQIAEEQVETYTRQQKAAVKERELREAEARARQQQLLTESEIGIAVQSNQGKAEYERAVQRAAQIRTLAEAEAEKAARVGIAQALATEEQVRAYGGPQYQVLQGALNRFAEAIQEAKVDIVPKVVIGNAGTASADGKNGSFGGSGLLEGMITVLLSEKLGIDVQSNTSRDPRAKVFRDDLLKTIERGPDQPR